MRTRLAHLAALDGAERVLIIGEGDGRFLAALCRRNSACRVVCVERSRAMIERARNRLASDPDRVTFVQADVRELQLPTANFDGLVTHFVLDLFDEKTLERLTPRLAQALAPGGVWLVADFALPSSGMRRLRAQGWLAFLYAFFRSRTDLESRRLPDPGPLLAASGLRCENIMHRQAGLLASRCWRKREPAS
jgi:ubiquinone/menaquinone biosynthesis C-methylase UbiE